NWVDETDDTEGLEKLGMSWDSVNQGAGESTTNAAGSNYDKGISLELIFTHDAFSFIWDWLLSEKCQILNAIDVRIDDVLCGKSFRIFEIKADNLKYRPDDDCRLFVKLREADQIWHCVHKTFIWDNHQNWFNQTGTSGKVHPTFLTCIEPRPRILNSARMGFMFFIQSNPVINLVSFITNGNIKDDTRRILELENFVPAPLIRDYIDNVAAKCGMAADTIFHRQGTPEHWACIFHPAGGQMYQNDNDSETSPSNKFIFENRWSVTLAELLDKLRDVYCAEWYVTPNNTIVFKPIAELIDIAPIYDFTTGSFSMEDLEYTFDGKKKAAFGRYQYQPDGSDLGSQEIANLYNDIVDFDGPSNNPMLEGEKSKALQFAPTAFVRDGRTPDYIRLLINDGETVAYILLTIIAFITLYAGILAPAMVGGGFPNGGGAIALVAVAAYLATWIITIAAKANDIRTHFTDEDGAYSGAVRLVSGNQTMMPRILIWDQVNSDAAHVVKTTAGAIAASSYYNPVGTAYQNANPIGTDNPANKVYNYPVYFDANYTGNLFDRFHDEIDNPLKSLETNQSFSFTTDLCCGAMDLLGLWDGDFVKIGYLLKIESRPNYSVYGRIENIDVSYAEYTIKIKGKVIKK
ncbi:MAG: hypothetical protein WKF88_09370, partial [Ferruginibacter sp.]